SAGDSSFRPADTGCPLIVRPKRAHATIVVFFMYFPPCRREEHAACGGCQRRGRFDPSDPVIQVYCWMRMAVVLVLVAPKLSVTVSWTVNVPRPIESTAAP